MSDYPQLSTRLVGETESALGALLAPLLAEAEMTFLQWVVLSLTAPGGASSPGIDRDQLIERITNIRKVDAADVSTAIDELENAAALVIAGGQVTQTDLGRASSAGSGRVSTRSPTTSSTFRPRTWPGPGGSWQPSARAPTVCSPARGPWVGSAT